MTEAPVRRPIEEDGAADPAVRAIEDLMELDRHVNREDITEGAAAAMDTMFEMLFWRAMKARATTIEGVLKKLEYFYKSAVDHDVGAPEDIKAGSEAPINWIASVERDLRQLHAEGRADA